MWLYYSKYNNKDYVCSLAILNTQTLLSLHVAKEYLRTNLASRPIMERHSHYPAGEKWPSILKRSNPHLWGYIKPCSLRIKIHYQLICILDNGFYSQAYFTCTLSEKVFQG